MKLNDWMPIVKALQIGWEVAFLLGASMFLSYWIDQALGTTPWGMILGIIIGIVAAFVRFLKVGQ